MLLYANLLSRYVYVSFQESTTLFYCRVGQSKGPLINERSELTVHAC